MAATLIHIKSRMLLPRDPELEKIDPEGDPRKELVDRLLEYERFKNAAEMLREKRVVEEAVWSNPQITRFAAEDEEPGLAVTLFDLVRTLEQVIERAKNRPLYEVTGESVSVPDMVVFLRERMKSLRRSDSVAVVPLFEEQHSRRAMICLFLAILELVKQQAIALTQKEAFGEIHVKKGVNFEETLNNDEAVAKTEEDYKN
jgi:segregation and condensation protein A